MLSSIKQEVLLADVERIKKELGEFQLNYFKQLDRTKKDIKHLEEAVDSLRDDLIKQDTQLKRLDLAMGAFKDLDKRLNSLEEKRLDSLPIKKFWRKLWRK